MTRRKKRLVVVLDTNVLVRAFKAGSNTNWNRRIVRLWLIEGKLQLVVAPELIDEYLGIFDEVLGMDAESVNEWRQRFESDGRTTLVNLGRRFTAIVRSTEPSAATSARCSSSPSRIARALPAGRSTSAARTTRAYCATSLEVSEVMIHLLSSG